MTDATVDDRQSDTTSQPTNSDVVTNDDLERLKELARERWGDYWTIRQNHYADGTTREYAEHTVGPAPDSEHEYPDKADVSERERLWVDTDDEYYLERVHIRRDTRVLEDEIGDL